MYVIYIYIYIYLESYVHNIFTINFKWQVVTIRQKSDISDGHELKLVTACHINILKNYYENVVEVVFFL